MFTRAFATVAGRRVHYRRGGGGPPVLLVHQSPQDSRAMLPLAERLLDRCTVIAADTPHFGLSETLDEPTIPAFADVLGGLLAALSLPPACVLGVHTGALIAVELGLRHPDRVGRVIADGYGLFTREERAQILAGYLPPNPPRADGGHLAWLWQRFRDQYVFFPWHVQRAASRLSYPVPEPRQLHRTVMEVLPRGDDYIGGYRAPFVHGRGEALARLSVPSRFVYRADDVLAAHRERLPPLPSCCSVETVGPGRAATDDHLVALVRAWADGARAAAPAPLAGGGDGTAAAGGEFQRMVGPPGRQLRVLRAGAGPALLLLHPLGRSAASVDALGERLGGRFTVWRPDLPGHGASDAPEVWTTGDAAARLADALPLERFGVVLGIGSAAPLVDALVARSPGLTAWYHDPLPLTREERYAWREPMTAPIEPAPAGAHLLVLWERVRDGRLFFPFFERGPAGRREGEPELDPASLQAEVTEALLCGEHWPAIQAAALQAAFAPASGSLVTADPHHPLRDRLAPRLLPFDEALEAAS